MDETKLGDEVDDSVLLRYLHGDGEIVERFGREKDVDCFLLEGWVGRLMTDLDDVKLDMSEVLFEKCQTSPRYSGTWETVLEWNQGEYFAHEGGDTE